jgi:uncharacterized membrane protein YfcA
MPGGWEFVATVGIVFSSGIVVGLAGFGFSLFAVPPLLLLHDPGTVVALVLLLGFASGLFVLWGEWDEIESGTLKALLPWSFVGLIVGAGVQRYVDESIIKLFASILVAIFALLMAAGIRIPGTEHRASTQVAGFSSGVLGTAAGLPGPPIALLFTARNLPPAAFRVTITGYFVIIDIVAVGVLIVSGQAHLADVWLALMLAPAALVGRWLGKRLADRIAPAEFRRIVIALLLLTGAIGAISAVLSIS